MGLLPRIRIPLRRNSISDSCWKNDRSFPEKTKLFDKKTSIRYSSAKKHCSPHKTIMNIHLAESHISSELIRRIYVLSFTQE